MTRISRFAAAPAIVAALALAACSQGGPSSSAGASASASATPSASASATAATTPQSPSAAATGCATDGIVPGRLGCLDANLPIAGNPGESAVAWEADYCSPGEGRYVYSSAPNLIGLAGQDGAEIGRIDVYDPSLTTAAGIHVGSTEAEVAAAYPDLPVLGSDPETRLVVVSGDEGFLTIELANGWGVDPWTVANIRVYAADQDANVHVYGTEDFAGACPMDV